MGNCFFIIKFNDPTYINFEYNVILSNDTNLQTDAVAMTSAGKIINAPTLAVRTLVPLCKPYMYCVHCILLI